MKGAIIAENLNATILNVDDNEPSRYTTTRILVQAGCEVLQAGTGADALRLAKHNPDLILLDINLPDVSGFEVCRRLKADPETANIQVLHLSAAHNDSRSRVIGLDGGADGYLTHPVDTDVLIATIRSLLRLSAAEKKLRVSEAHLRTILNAEPECVKCLDRDCVLLDINPAGVAMIEADSVEQLIGKSMLPFVDSQYRDAFRAMTEKVFLGESCKLEFQILGLKGSQRWLETHSCPLRDASGSVTALLGVTRDITGQKHAEQALSNSYVFNRQIIDCAAEGFAVYDRDLRFVVWNRFMEGISGIPVADVLGRRPEEVFPFLSKTGVIANLKRALAGETVATTDTPFFVPQSGRSGWSSAHHTPLRNAQDEIIGVISTVRDVTERKIAEQGLLESEQRFRHILHNAADAILVIDHHAKIVMVNEQAETSFGFAAGELTGQPLDRLIPERLRTRHAQYVREYLHAPRIRSMGAGLHLSARRKDGSEFPVEISLSPLQLDDGMLVTAVIRDISERGKHEKLLQDIAEAVSENIGIEFFRSLTRFIANTVEAEHVFICRVEPNGTMATSVAAFSGGRFLETITYNILDTPYWQAVHEQRLCLITSGMQQRFPDDPFVKEANIESYVGIPLMAADGQVQGVLSALFQSPLEHVDHVLALLRIFAARAGAELERMLNEERLRLAESNYRSIFENAVDGIFRSTPDGRLLTVNPAFARFSGYDSPHEMLTVVQDVATQLLVIPQRRAEFKAALEANGTVQGFESEYRRKDGSTFWASVSARVVRDNAGAILYYEGFCKDVSLRKGLEEQLRHSQKMEAVGQLAGGVAHDFNNLLTVINGNVEIVINSLPPQDSHKGLLAEVVKAGNRAASLTEQLLAFSRKQILAPRVVNLNEIVVGSETLVRRMIGEDIHLVTKLGPGLNKVRVDSGQIELAIMNLAVNARDAMPQGGSLTIATCNLELDGVACRKYVDGKPGSYALLAIADTGNGMTAEVQARIFEPFFTTKEVGRGTGLGLATVYGIVKQSGGLISVDSVVGVGTTFKILLPTTKEVPTSPEFDATPQVARQGNETILLAEDEDGVRKLARMILTMHGYQVLEASNGQEALQLEQNYKGPIHLLLTDLVMPKMGGRQLVDSIRPRHHGLKVLFMSGYNDDIRLSNGGQATMDDCLQKPFSIHTLATKVREILDA